MDLHSQSNCGRAFIGALDFTEVPLALQVKERPEVFEVQAQAGAIFGYGHV